MKCQVILDSAQEKTLEQMALNHRHRDYRVRAAGLLQLARGGKPAEIAARLEVSHQSIYNWSAAWHERGLVGLMGGHTGGRPFALGEAMLETAIKVATASPMTLKDIRQAIEAEHQCNLPCSLGTLSNRLKERGLSFKRTRFSLEKNATRKNLP